MFNKDELKTAVSTFDFMILKVKTSTYPVIHKTLGTFLSKLSYNRNFL